MYIFKNTGFSAPFGDHVTRTCQRTYGYCQTYHCVYHGDDKLSIQSLYPLITSRLLTENWNQAGYDVSSKVYPHLQWTATIV